MKIKINKATQKEKNNLFIFLLNLYKKDCEKFPSDNEFDEIDEYLNIKKESISIQKFEIELDGIIKIIFNRISFMNAELNESEFVMEKGEKVLKPNGKISKSVFHSSSFYEFEDNKFIDITEDDIIPFGYY